MNNDKLIISFRFMDPSRYQVSAFSLSAMLALFKFFEKLEARTWQQVYDTAGKSGNNSSKTGVRFTQFSTSPLPLPSKVSRDETIFELTVRGAIRVFAFREGDACNFVWFDEHHKLT